jgi:glycosyltransferase involved in cell wall biosynthesis
MEHDNISNPKISFISSVYNKEKYLTSFISSIQNQLLNEFELIIVDDCSTDNSVKIINHFQKKDKRIKLIKNAKNMGALNARYNGAIHSKGEYILFVDSDDIVLKDGILKAYNYIKKKNLDMVEFHTVFDSNNTSFINRRFFFFSDIIQQPILSYIFYYNKNNGDEKNAALWDKIIKRKVVMKSLKYIGQKYLNENIIIENDVILLFSIFKNSNSFQYIDELGYYYFSENKDSTTNTRYDPTKVNQVIHSIFTNIQFLYEKTEDTFLDKYYCIFKLKQAMTRYNICFNKAKQEYNLITTVLNNLLQSKFISIENKLNIMEIKLKINSYIK